MQSRSTSAPSMALRTIVLLLSLGIVGGYVAYRVLAAHNGQTPPQSAQDGDAAVHLGGTKSKAIVQPSDLTANEDPATFVGSKSAVIFPHERGLEEALRSDDPNKQTKQQAPPSKQEK
jgi:hypothetical protein